MVAETDGDENHIATKKGPIKANLKNIQSVKSILT